MDLNDTQIKKWLTYFKKYSIIDNIGDYNENQY